MNLCAGPSDPDKSPSQPPALLLSLMASQLEQFSIPPGAEQLPAFRGTEHLLNFRVLSEGRAVPGPGTPPTPCLHVKVQRARAGLLIKLGTITVKNEIWELATWHINKLLCE